MWLKEYVFTFSFIEILNQNAKINGSTINIVRFAIFAILGLFPTDKNWIQAWINFTIRLFGFPLNKNWIHEKGTTKS